MGGELDPIISTFKAIDFFLRSPWEQVEPFVSRVLWLVIVCLGIMWTYKKIKAIK
jgi:hypothetical protein